MEQVLFWIPIHTQWTPDGIPVYGFGTMLFLVFAVTTWLTGRRAERQDLPGVPAERRKELSERIRDLVLWIFLGGIVGARLFWLYQYRQQIKNPFLEFFQFWNGGIVFYGSALGGTVAGLIARRFLLSRFNVSVWQLGDILAPSIALGLCIGRIGCFLNGCCYGHPAVPGSPAVHFPLQTAPARELLVPDFQTPAGFAIHSRVNDNYDAALVGPVEPNSAAAQAGLRHGDEIVAVNGQDITKYSELVNALNANWPRGKKDVTLTVRRGGETVTLPPFIPRTLGLVPTQLYESVSMLLVFLVLIFLYPLRRYDGQLLVVLMLCYAVHRFFNETLRHDTPTYTVGGLLGLTISQWISLGIFAAATALGLWRRRYPLPQRPARTETPRTAVAQSA
jgi:prolipoprotein diacylglyceryl transferase